MGETFGESQGWFVAVGPDREERQFLHLCRRGGREFFATVTDLHAKQTRQSVEHPMALAVPHIAALAPNHDRSPVTGNTAEMTPEMLRIRRH